ncbi:MAG TPA: hypothetical protein VF245_09850 [Solirubrobacterales bacterium]
MNDIERLAEALRQANAGLDVDPVELNDVVAHAHGRLIRRLLFVAILSALATALLLSGSLAASDVIGGNQDKPGKDDGSSASSNGEKNGGNGGHHDQGSGDRSGGHRGGQKDGGGKEEGGDKKEGDRSEKDKGGGTKAPDEELPDLVVLEVTETEVLVEDRSDFATESSFTVLITVPETEFKESFSFEGILPAREPLPIPLEESPECQQGDEIVAFVDADKSVAELDEKDNEGSGKCEASENGETTTTSKEEASANAVAPTAGE